MANKVLLHPGDYYHVYNRGNNYQQTFFCKADYDNFLFRWKKYIQPVAKTYAYCLLPNHFHALVQIRPELKDLRNGAHTILRAWTNLFIAYSRVTQERHQTHGVIFHKPFKRRQMNADTDFDKTLIYILLNPIKHGLVNDFRQYAHSAAGALLSNRETLLEREEVLLRFGGRESLLACLLERQRDFS